MNILAGNFNGSNSNLSLDLHRVNTEFTYKHHDMVIIMLLV